VTRPKGRPKSTSKSSKPKTVQIVTKAAYARRIGVSPQYISKLIKQGKLSTEPDGKIDVKNADAMIKALRRPERDPFRKSIVPETDNDDAIANYGNYQKARTIKAAYQARLTQLEYEEASGAVVKKGLMKSATFVAARTCRDAILAIPKRVSALIASHSEKDRQQVEQILHKEFVQALTSLSEDELAHMFGESNET